MDFSFFLFQTYKKSEVPPYHATILSSGLITFVF